MIMMLWISSLFFMVELEISSYFRFLILCKDVRYIKKINVLMEILCLLGLNTNNLVLLQVHQKTVFILLEEECMANRLIVFSQLFIPKNEN